MLKKITTVFGLMLGFVWLAAQAQAAAEAVPSISLKSAVNGQEITVFVTGDHLKDLYAYDLIISYDPGKLVYQNASSGASGFGVDPIVKNGDIRIAHTKVGKIAGDNGTKELASAKFTRLDSGTTSVSVHDVKLVDSKLNAAAAGKAEISIENSITSTTIALKDIEGHWAKDSIQEAVRQGWITGYANGTFQPNKEVTRTEFAAMLIRALGDNSTDRSQPLKFTDVQQIPPWARPLVEAAVLRGIMNGYENGSFGPGKLITRAEMATMAIRSLNLAEAVKNSDQPSFADNNQIPAWAKPYAAAVEQKGIMKGRSGNMFAPGAHATRAEAVVVILAVLQRQ
ncbi:S-layer homology domain-containing protein [Paenibacillus sp.]|uniref:S-layer homology domain-containing protein n=1 Tax=Paenibacillus sp. TaxID=58172 RepID=UPI002819E4C5|nr:S-layer homology domain-containing protein [Paenibacillus sp.]MDR0268193.1 S-layer homology domain-containing protein [Paenibacillus sp.]